MLYMALDGSDQCWMSLAGFRLLLWVLARSVDSLLEFWLHIDVV